MDTEHKGLGREAQAIGVSLADRLGNAWYWPFGHACGQQHEASVVRQFLKDHLVNRDIVFRAAKNDIEVLRRWGLDLEAMSVRPHEVQHADALLDDRIYITNDAGKRVRRSFSLDGMMLRYLGRQKVKLDFHPDTIWRQPPSKITEYAREDARGVRDLWNYFLPKIKKQELDAVLKLEDELIYCTLAMERVGSILDLEKLERWDHEIKEKYVSHIMEIHRRTGLRVNPNSDDVAKLFRHEGIKHTGYFTDSVPPAESFTDEALEAWAGEWVGVGKDRHFEIRNINIQLVREARQLDSLRTKYTSKYLNGHIGGILYYQLHQLASDEGGTITGRYASSGIEVGGQRMGGNIQQVTKPDKQDPITEPWIIRDLFIPPRGRYYLDADASQIEFRLMVHYTKSERLIKMYQENPNQDFHQMVTDDILHNIMSRTLAKNFNFMKVYGGGLRKVMKMTGLDEIEAAKMDEEYKRMFPESGDLLDFATKTAEKRGWVKTYLGRRRRYYEGDRYYSALNSVLQGTAADLMKLALLAQYNERKRLDLILRATVHDESIGDVGSPEDAVKVNHLLNEQRLPLRVPITWETGIGKSWYTCSKKGILADVGAPRQERGLSSKEKYG
jgi:DNA polymerase-1